MALSCSCSSACASAAKTTAITPVRPFLTTSISTSSRSPRTLLRFTVSAANPKKTGGRFDSKNRRTTTTTTTKEQEDDNDQRISMEDKGTAATAAADGFVMPELPGEKTDFWEGPQWDALGFFVEYLWAFGIVFALVACGIAVATYNEGATDFKDTPVYKESIQSRELLEEPEASNSDVFESNPTEQAPDLN